MTAFELSIKKLQAKSPECGLISPAFMNGKLEIGY